MASVWTTSSTGLDTVLATLGSTIGSQTHQNALLHHQSQSQQHLLSIPKSHSAHHLNIVSNGGLSTASNTNGSGSSPATSSHHHNHLHNSQAQHLNAIHHHQYQSNSNYNSNNHLFLPYQHQNSTNASWNKSGNVYQQKVIICLL